MTESNTSPVNYKQSSLKQIFSKANSSVLGYLAVFVASACWGTSGIFVNFILTGSHFSALSLAFWRDTLTCLVLLTGIGLVRPAWLRVKKKDIPWLAAVGASVGIFHVFWNLGVFLNGAAVATVQQAAGPAIVAIVAWALWQETLTWGKLLAILLTFTGTVLVSDIGVLSQTQFNLGGFLVGLGIPIAYASWMLFGKKIRGNYNPLTILTYAFGFGALVLFPFQFFTAMPWPVPPITWLWVAGLIGIATIGGFSTFIFSLGKLPASVASILAMAEIPIVAVYAFVLLNELMTLMQTFGAVLVVIGVLLLFQRKKQLLPQTS